MIAVNEKKYFTYAYITFYLCLYNIKNPYMGVTHIQAQTIPNSVSQNNSRIYGTQKTIGNYF